RPSNPHPETTLLLGWNKRAPQIIELLDAFAFPGSVLRVACSELVDQRIATTTNLTIETKACDPTSRVDLEGLDPQSCQHAIVLSTDGLSAQESDARTLITLLHLRDLAASLEHPYSIVSEINDDTNRELAEVIRAAVFVDLFNPTGAEIYLKPAAGYLVPGLPANFATIAEAAARDGETALGYRIREQFYQPPAYGVVLNPPKDQMLTLTDRDLVLVLAER
ncbi:MAG TPA: hypothetical protein VGK66_06770, partial [Solirubrobacterales bacterium]